MAVTTAYTKNLTLPAGDNPGSAGDPTGLSWWCPSWSWCPGIVGGVEKHWKGVVEIAGVTLTVVATGASVIATGGLDAPAVITLDSGVIGTLTATATVASTAALAANASLAAVECSKHPHSLNCAADVAGAFASGVGGRVTEAGIVKIFEARMPKKAAEQLASNLGTQMEANISTLVTATRAACSR